MDIAGIVNHYVFSRPLASIVVIGILSLLMAWGVTRQVKRADVGTQKMREISEAIHEGAMAFLMREYRTLAWFIVIMAAVIFIFLDHPATKVNEAPWTALAFVCGAVISIVAGFIGMKIATKANVRTANAARTSISGAFTIAFRSGTVLGFGLVGLAVLGISSLYILMTNVLGIDVNSTMEILTGFALGGSSIALFARVGGGIYTKAADVGADLVGKVEAGIPEDDPRNPAVIADNVGDNVGDVAGMGADLFGSGAESTCAAMVIGAIAFGAAGVQSALLYPLAVSAVGILAAFIAIRFIRLREGGNVEGVLKKGLTIASVLVLAAMYYLTAKWLPATFTLHKVVYTSFGVYVSLAMGLIAGLLIGFVTEYFTSHAYKPVRNVARSSETGAATNIIQGIALGYESAVIPIILIAVTAFTAFKFAGLYGVAISAIGMLSTLVIALAIDAYGPVSDNAGGIAEMAGLPKEVRKKTDVLDAAGNTTAAIGKGFAIGSAALTALALFSAFIAASGIDLSVGVNLLDNKVIAGLLIGGMLPFLFSAMTMKAVARAAEAMIIEVRRQFKTIKGLMQGKAKADYRTCVDISTKAALREMIAPGLLVVLTPIVVGVLFGIEALAGVLAGALASGVILAISKANAGGAWDNAKKYIEAGQHGGKGSDAHHAAVVGDTVGDPMKDTSGPSLNILLKLMAIISLVFVPLFVKHGGLLLGYL
ncbi:TPA: V-type H(+)-translocating pyrophosphatase [Candidatus Woesearchaeota archaeon]|nr:V-type H(+)-translocating pyrophosphatase [Candidatus Woesearchaeota archaeon]